MQRRNLRKRIVFRSRSIVTVVAVLALLVLNVVDVHAAETEPHEFTAELVQVDDEASTTKASADVGESHFCQSTPACHATLDAAFEVTVWTEAGNPAFATLFDRIGSSAIDGLFRPPKRA